MRRALPARATRARARVDGRAGGREREKKSERAREKESERARENESERAKEKESERAREKGRRSERQNEKDKKPALRAAAAPARAGRRTIATQMLASTWHFSTNVSPMSGPITVCAARAHTQLGERERARGTRARVETYAQDMEECRARQTQDRRQQRLDTSMT